MRSIAIPAQRRSSPRPGAARFPTNTEPATSPSGCRRPARTPTIEPGTFPTTSSRPPNGTIQPPRAIQAFIRSDDLTAAGPAIFALVPKGTRVSGVVFRMAITIFLAGSALAGLPDVALLTSVRGRPRPWGRAALMAWPSWARCCHARSGVVGDVVVQDDGATDGHGESTAQRTNPLAVPSTTLARPRQSGGWLLRRRASAAPGQRVDRRLPLLRYGIRPRRPHMYHFITASGSCAPSRQCGNGDAVCVHPCSSQRSPDPGGRAGPPAQ